MGVTQAIDKNGATLDNHHIVPYNSMLLLKYQAHINMEWCNKSTSIKYLFKYIHKGYDCITAVIVPTQNETSSQIEAIDEIKQFVDCRYVSPCEACWRIFYFSIHRIVGNRKEHWVPPSTRELFYLRMMLTAIKGPCNYEDIRIVDNVIYPAFKEACFAMGFLEDDRNI
ncbi:hypothetical protein Lal_00012587 [Lupinus albus]|nr:hypothetical protein Lal_00012587 [Lupinus albus]